MKQIPNCYLSAGEISRLTGHGRATVQRWIIRGELEPDYYLPSESAHCRVELKELRRFLRSNNMPTPEKFLSMHKIDVATTKVTINLSETKVKTKRKKRPS